MESIDRPARRRRKATVTSQEGRRGRGGRPENEGQGRKAGGGDKGEGPTPREIWRVGLDDCGARMTVEAADERARCQRLIVNFTLNLCRQENLSLTSIVEKFSLVVFLGVFQVLVLSYTLLSIDGIFRVILINKIEILATKLIKLSSID